MKEVEQLIYQRMIADTAATVSLKALLGDTSPSTRIIHSHQLSTPPSPGITYSVYAASPGQIAHLTREVFVTFNIFAQNYSDIAARLMKLFDRYQHSLSLISGGATQVGSVASVFDFEGPDGFDEGLEVQKKDLRFRFFVVPKAQNPI